MKGGQKMSNCNKISQLFSAYIDGEVTAKEKEMVEVHLKECASCKQKLDLMLKTKDILKTTPQIPVPETLLKDFAEYRKKSEQNEKKVVPLYKNYRVYASVAAIFIFAFVLKTGLWQENKYLPNDLTQSQITDQSLSAPVENDNKAPSNEETPDAENAAGSRAISDQSANQPEVAQNADTKILTQVSDDANNASEDQTAAVSEASEQGNSGSGAYSEDLVASPMSRTRQVTEADEEAISPDHAIVYVSEDHFEKATKLLSDGKFFYAQVEQRLSDNRIPFESNFLSLDEGIPHKVVVMVKE